MRLYEMFPINTLMEAPMHMDAYVNSLQKASELGMLMGFEAEVCVPKNAKFVKPKKDGEENAPAAPEKSKEELLKEKLAPYLKDEIISVFNNISVEDNSDLYRWFSGQEKLNDKHDSFSGWTAQSQSELLDEYTNYLETTYFKSFFTALGKTKTAELFEAMLNKKVGDKKLELKNGNDVNSRRIFIMNIIRKRTEVTECLTNIGASINAKRIYRNAGYYDGKKYIGYFLKNNYSLEEFLAKFKVEINYKGLEYQAADDGWFEDDEDNDDYWDDGTGYVKAKKIIEPMLTHHFGKVVVFKEYHQRKKDTVSWYLEPDGSLEPKNGDGSAEIVSPPEAVKKILITWRSYLLS